MGYILYILYLITLVFLGISIGQDTYDGSYYLAAIKIIACAALIIVVASYMRKER